MKKRMQSMTLIVVVTMFFAGVSQASDDVSITQGYDDRDCASGFAVW